MAALGLSLGVLMACGAPDGADRGAPPPTPEESPPTIEFRRASSESGLGFVYSSGSRGDYLMPEIMGGGAALFDMDNDGDLDVFLVQGGPLDDSPGDSPGDRLFENVGSASGVLQFRDITEASGIHGRGYGHGAAAGDVDNDGDVDLYVTNLGANVLYENLGAGRFKDITDAAGVARDAWSTSAGFVDVDRDGDLDLYVTQYLRWSRETEIPCFNARGARDYCSPNNYNAPARDVLYRNDSTTGGSVTFSDVSESMGLDRAFGNGLGVAISDFNGDGWLDVFVANDGMDNQLWVHRDGILRDEALISGCAVDREGVKKAGMGVAAEDVDLDGDIDVLVGNLHRESDSFFSNEGDGRFLDQTLSIGLGVVSRKYTRFGLGLRDFDNDGHLDLFQANGRVTRHSASLADDPYAEPNVVLRGGAGGAFKLVTTSTERATDGWGDVPRTSRAAAFGDLNSDGGVDVVVVNRDAEIDVLQNVSPDRGRWLLVRLVESSGRDAYHAILRAQVDGRAVTRYVNPVYSYQANHDPRIHIGLGDATQLTDVEVAWPDGSRQSFGDLAADQIVELRRRP
ncbi:MAG: CRTAC1 family protein [Acidobacteriota bacterium]